MFFRSRLNSNNTEKKKPNEPVRIYVWPTTFESRLNDRGTSAGHAAISTGVDNHMGLWPHGIPAMGPTVIVPLKADLAKELKEDIIAEEPPLYSPDMDEMTYSWYKNPRNHTALAAPMVFETTVADTNAIKAEMDKVKQQVKTGEIRYQLFPNVRLFSGLINSVNSISKSSLNIITADPFSQLPNPHLSEELALLPNVIMQVHNCTSLVKHILAKGGIQLKKHPLTPWGTSPSALAVELDKHAAFNEVGLTKEEAAELDNYNTQRKLSR